MGTYFDKFQSTYTYTINGINANGSYLIVLLGKTLLLLTLEFLVH